MFYVAECFRIGKTTFPRDLEIADITEPSKLNELSFQAYYEDLKSRLNASSSMQHGGVLAVAGSATVLSLSGVAFAWYFEFAVPKQTSVLTWFDATLAYTDGDGASISRVLSLEPLLRETGNPGIFILGLKDSSGLRQVSLSNSSGVSLTVASNKLPVGTAINGRSFVKKDFDKLGAMLGARTVRTVEGDVRAR
jgi:hypothetical protein